MITMNALGMILGLGFLLGLRHATEADHLVAVATLVSEGRSLPAAALTGACWGLGHTLTLTAAGLGVLGLGMTIPDTLARSLELAVAVMIVALGLRLLWTTVRRPAPVRRDGPPAAAGSRMALLVGGLHGLAGTATLTLLIQAELGAGGRLAEALAFLLTFGAGSIGGMVLMAGLVGLPFAWGARRGMAGPGPIRVLRLLAGAGSVAFGAWYGLGG